MKTAKRILGRVAIYLITQLLVLWPLNESRASTTAIQYLTHGWQLARVPDVTQSGSQISLTSFDASTWIVAAVPGTVLTSYQNAGVIPDPYFGTNMVPLVETGYYDTYYWYRDDFYVPPNYSDQEVWLNFDGINWKADIYVNGSYVGRLNGPFKRGKYDVTSLLTTGATNCVAVMLYWSNASVYDSPTFIAAEGWDFMPVFLINGQPGQNVGVAGRDVGLYQNVYLSTSGSVTIVDPFISTTLPLPNTSPASLTLQAELTNSSASVVSGVLSGVISPEGISFQTNLTVNASSATNFTFNPSNLPQLSIADPALWWPNGYGPQNLHNLQLSFQVDGSTSDVQNVSFGIRQYSYKTNGGMELQVSCNGQRIMCKGGNWGMPDAMLKFTPDQLDMAVRLHKEMNFTMIRCWHGTSDLEAFYDACDKYGIMVWDEFWLNGSNFGLGPNDPAMFITNSIDKYKRLRNRACLVVWCGENEAVPQANLFLPQNYSNYDNTRIYIAASNQGPVHGGGPYEELDPNWYFNNAHGFTTELGSSCVPTLESMQAMIPVSSLWPPGDLNWVLHNWQYNIDSYTNQLATSYGLPTDISNFCAKAQLLNYQTYRAMFEAWDAQMWTAPATNPCSGVLLWMSQAAWPSIIWQTYDWDFNPTGGYFGSKKGCEPIHIQWDSNDNSVRVVNATAQPLAGLIAQIEVYNLNGTLQFGTNLANLGVSADSVTNVFALFGGSWTNSLSSVHFIRLKLNDNMGNVLSDNFYWRGTTYNTYTSLNSLSPVTPSCSASYSISNAIATITVVLTNATTNVAFAAVLKLINQTTGARVLPAIYSDNYFSLLPGESEAVTIEFATNGTSSGPLQLMLNGWNIPPQQFYSLTVNPGVPTISSAVALPSNTVNQWTAASLVCSNWTGTPPYAFQWQMSGTGVNYTNISAATSNVLSLTNVSFANSGYYRLVFTADAQSVTSSVAPLTILGGAGGSTGARLAIKFAADRNYGYDSINNGWPAGVLNTRQWFNLPGPDGASNGVSKVPFYSTNGVTTPSSTVLVYDYPYEYNTINEQTTLPNNIALLDSYISMNDGWYLSATNLDSVFTNSYNLYFYFLAIDDNGSKGGKNFVRYYSGFTTGTPVLGTRQWNLFTTTTNNDQAFIQDETPANTSTTGETPGANYFVISNLTGGAFDLLITNSYYGGLCALEIVANPLATASVLSVSTNSEPYGTTLTFTNKVSPAPPDGELVMIMDGAAELGVVPLSGGVATYSSSSLGIGTNLITAVYAGDANYLASVSNVLPVTVTTSPPFSITWTPVGSTALRLSWESVPQQSYQVESSTNLATGIWIANTAVQASGTTTSVLVFMTMDQEYFRITASY